MRKLGGPLKVTTIVGSDTQEVSVRQSAVHSRRLDGDAQRNPSTQSSFRPYLSVGGRRGVGPADLCEHPKELHLSEVL